MASYQGHHSEFFLKLYGLQQGGAFTDVKVRGAGERSFECHKVVLAAMSPFVEAMLQTSMMVSNDKFYLLTLANIFSVLLFVFLVL